MSDEALSADEIQELDKKQLRKQFPSGWMKTARFETNVLVIDALLEEPPNREFTIKELANESGASDRSIKNRIKDLLELGVVIELPNREDTRYQINQNSPIVQKLYELNTTVERVQEGDLEKSVSSHSETREFKHEGNLVNLTGGRESDNSFSPNNSHAF